MAPVLLVNAPRSKLLQAIASAAVAPAGKIACSAFAQSGGIPAEGGGGSLSRSGSAG